MKEKPTFNDNLMVRLDGNQDGVLTKDEFVDGGIKVIKSFFGMGKSRRRVPIFMERNVYFRMLESSPL